MKLVHEDVKEDIVFDEGYINVWVIEDKSMLNKFVRELLSQADDNEGGFVLCDNNAPLKIKDNMNIITDYFSIPINSKRVKGKITKLLEEIAEGEMPAETLRLKSQIQQYLEFLIEQTDLNIDYDDDFEIGGILKLADIRAEKDYETLLESICAYMKLITGLFEDQVFVFVNLKQYMEPADIVNLHRFIEYEKVNVLLIENSTAEKREDEKYLILDHDFCVI